MVKPSRGLILFVRLLIAVRATVVALPVVALVLPLAAALGMRAMESSAQAIASGGPSLSPTRLEIYGGYAYFHPLGGTIATRPYAAIQPGVVGSVTGYFNRTLGVQLEGGASPMGPNDSVYTAQVGPVIRYSYGRFSPFAHALGGVARVRGPSLQPPTYGWGLTGGIGLDYVLPGFQRRIAIRPIQADYEFSHVDYGKLAANGLTGGLGEIKAYRLSAGVVLRFGGSLQKERPLVYACSASPAQVFAGEPVTVTGSSTGPATRNRSIYTWEASGGSVAATDDTATIATADLAPGDYLISGHLSQGGRAEENASCTESFTVLSPVPPTISCSANPVSVKPHGLATITAIANSEQHRPLSFSYSSSAGQIASSTSVATLNAGDALGSITVDCRVSDDLGQVTKATTTVYVSAPPAPVAKRRSLCSLSFERDRKRPVRVDNEAKACLDDVALEMNRDATARLAITGENSADEKGSQATQRASNARIYLTQEKGIDPARIDVKTGSVAGRAAEIELIPMGTPVRYSDAPASSAPVSSATGSSIPGAAANPAQTPPAHPGMDNAGAPRSYEAPGVIGPRRSANSLVLPPLPADAVSHNRVHKGHTRHATVKRRGKRKPARVDGSAAAAVTTTPGP